MKKSTLLMIVSVVLALTLSLGSTLAYLQDSDSDVNVMTLGNVYIEQLEFERELAEDGSSVIIDTPRGESLKLVEFTQNKPLYPAVGKVTDWEEPPAYFVQFDENPVEGEGNWYGSMPGLEGLNNVVDKFVFVKNTGKSDAYVRTFIAYEIGSSENAMTAAGENDLISTAANVAWKSTDVGAVEISGNKYWVVEYLYDGNFYQENGTIQEGKNARHPDGIVHPGDYTYNSLAQIYMAPEATNEDMDAIDGNKNGTYDILVLSQAVQAMGFYDPDTALNAGFNAKNEDGTTYNLAQIAEWFGGFYPTITVTDAAELEEALGKAAPGQTIKLAAGEWGDVKLTGELEDVTISAEGVEAVKFIVTPEAKLTNVTFADINVTYNGGNVGYKDGGIINIQKGAQVKNLVIEEGVFTATGGNSLVVGINEPTAEVTLNKCKIDGPKYTMYSMSGFGPLTIVDCEIKNQKSWIVQAANAGANCGPVTMSGNTLDNCVQGLIKLGSDTQTDIVFTNNELINCGEHEPYGWFDRCEDSNVTVSGNKLDGVEWNPGAAEGLGK